MRTAGRFANAEDQDPDADEARRRRKPEDEPEIIGETRHQRHRKERTGEGADTIERLAQAVGGASQAERSEVADQRVAGRAPDAFPDAVGEAGEKHPRRGRSHGEQRLGERAKAVPDHGQRLALAEPVA